MKIIHTLASSELDHGGPSRSVPSLCESMAKRGADITFLTSRPTDSKIAVNLPQPPVTSLTVVKPAMRFASLSVYRAFTSTLQSVLENHRNGGANSQGEILLHDHGVWLPSNRAVAQFATKNKIIRVVSPRGMLSTWALNRGRWKKGIAWFAYQQADLQKATAFHVTAAHEAEEVRSLGLKQPIVVLPNGVSFPKSPATRSRIEKTRRMLFLSRIHPKKGLIELLRAWKTSNIPACWELVIAGPDEGGYRSQIENEIATLELNSVVRFIGSVDDEEKWQVFADADAFVLPSFSENFGIVVAEALAAGLPVITTTGTPWLELDQRRCGFCVSPTVAELAKALNELTNLSSIELAEMGKRGADWVSNEFTWDAIGAEMLAFYAWLSNRSDRPSSVLIDA